MEKKILFSYYLYFAHFFALHSQVSHSSPFTLAKNTERRTKKNYLIFTVQEEDVAVDEFPVDADVSHIPYLFD